MSKHSAGWGAAKYAGRVDVGLLAKDAGHVSEGINCRHALCREQRFEHWGVTVIFD
jgi:hypothetical protein